MTIAIQAEELGKKYLINHRSGPGNDTLRDELSGLLRGFGRRPTDQKYEEFWALRDLSFQIRQGERVGILGRNGAGKSTLLKILSRITEPSTGRVTIRGRVASLLEVGTGFHPELTGRENIFLNGAVLGMRKEEIRRKFDEIVGFAEVEKFLDTPVKRYSSGMYVRLAFAVAAHLDVEILIVDEVLAVGDAAFQKKCLARMANVGAQGTTVLFVSHNMAAIQNLCESAILLNGGSLIAHGAVHDVIHQYLEQSQELAKISLGDRADRTGNGAIRFTSFSLHDEAGRRIEVLRCGQHARLVFGFVADRVRDLRHVVFAAGVDNESGERITLLSNELAKEAFEVIPESVRSFEIEIERLPLTPGNYCIALYCSVNGEVADWIFDVGTFTVEGGDFYGTGKLPPSTTQGHILIPHQFHLRQ
jgi:lipopolysaccharide transport system ATP-binding protein